MLQNNRFRDKIFVNTTKRFKIVQSPLSLVVFGQGFNVGEHDMGKLNNLLGLRFGKLVVIARSENDKHKNARWLCQCDCGNTKVVVGSSLIKGHTKSCGCVRKHLLQTMPLKHGKKNTRLYNIWIDMKRRCNSKNRKSYKDYGGRGIVVCNEWLQDFMNFYNWAIANGYKENLTIDRIDVNGNYEPNNCRWIEKGEQNRNQRTNLKFTYKGETHCLKEWAEILKINYNTLHSRLTVLGYSVEKAFLKPVQECGR